MTPTRITLVRREELRPPLVALVADIALRNDDGQPRWWLVARTAGPGTGPVGQGGVHSVEIAPSNDVLVARFAGAASFGALRLDAGDEVTLREWTVTVWDDPPVSTVGIDIVSAAEVTVGGSPIAKGLERGTWPGENLEVFRGRSRGPAPRDGGDRGLTLEWAVSTGGRPPKSASGPMKLTENSAAQKGLRPT